MVSANVYSGGVVYFSKLHAKLEDELAKLPWWRFQKKWELRKEIEGISRTLAWYIDREKKSGQRSY